MSKSPTKPAPKAFGTIGTSRILEPVYDRSAAAYIRYFSTLAVRRGLIPLALSSMRRFFCRLVAGEGETFPPKTPKAIQFKCGFCYYITKDQRGMISHLVHHEEGRQPKSRHCPLPPSGSEPCHHCNPADLKSLKSANKDSINMTSFEEDGFFPELMAELPLLERLEAHGVERLVTKIQTMLCNSEVTTDAPCTASADSVCWLVDSLDSWNAILYRAVRFVLTPSTDKQAAATFQKYHRSPVLLHKLKEAKTMSDKEAASLIRSAANFIARHFFIVTAVVKRTLQCERAKTTALQLTDLNEACLLKGGIGLYEDKLGSLACKTFQLSYSEVYGDEGLMLDSACVFYRLFSSHRCIRRLVLSDAIIEFASDYSLTVQRNLCALNRAARFVLAPAANKRAAEVFQDYERSPGLFRVLKETEKTSDLDVVRMVRSASTFIACHFFVVAGVVKERVQCEADGKTGLQLGDLDEVCMLKIVSYLKVCDVVS
ncbi:hypothetical protein HPB47_025707 [Ixodes persulcatus]|uniref:Uncharacterized protein n=1 Tax=Ixodes persulcatus TaxID=34615 RepID=A0AC60Q328_IXOPE|nr:hypothetical protein HPB47_025707 [Ixodes persulcatus]